MARVTILGRARLQRRLNAIPKAVKEAVKTGMEAQANIVVDRMKSLVPVDTGRLKNSIKWTWGRPPKGANVLGEVKNNLGSELTITIYAGDNSTLVAGKDKRFFHQLARLIEFGTMDTPAQPFFWVAWRDEKKKVRKTISASIRKAVRDSKT